MKSRTTGKPPGRPPKYPWRTMEIGESFIAYNRDAGSLCNDARRHHRPKRFRTKKVIRIGVVAIQVWRVE